MGALLIARRAYCVSVSNFSCVCVRPFVRPSVRALIFRPVLDRQNTDSKGICHKNCSVLGPTFPFLDHSPGSSGFEDLEDLGSETDKRGSEDQPSEAKSAPVVFFVKLVTQVLLCPESNSILLAEESRGAGRMEDSHAWHHRFGTHKSNYDQVTGLPELVAHRATFALQVISSYSI